MSSKDEVPTAGTADRPSAFDDLSGAAASRVLTCARAQREAVEWEMTNDPRVFMLGEDVFGMGGVFGTADGLGKKFGASRIVDGRVTTWTTGFYTHRDPELNRLLRVRFTLQGDWPAQHLRKGTHVLFFSVARLKPTSGWRLLETTTAP